ncbi:MAG: response regulator [Anaerolineales bacterium]|nr:MAG: response regulator [Anaerolineales bacterium]
MAGEKVLVIDDSVEILRNMKELVLGPNGYSFVGARDGQEGLRKAVAENPDLIVMDFQMPKMTGLEVLDALQERQSDIPVILMTFHGSEEIAVQAFRLGVKDYIIKPFEVEVMLAAIDRALTERRLRAERERLTKKVLQINKQLEHRITELNVLYTVGQSVTSLLNLEELLNRIVEAAVFVTGAEEGALLLVDKDTGELYLRAARNLGEKLARGFRLKVEHSIAGQVVKTGKPILQSTQDEEMLKVKTGYLVKSLVNVPLKAKGKVIGVLAVDNKVSSKPFTGNDVYLLSALADYAAIAIENARLYKDTGDKADQLDTLLQIAQSTTSQLDLEAVLQMIVDSAVTKLGAGVATLYLYDPTRDEFPAPVTAGQIDHPEEMIAPTKDSVVYRMLRQEGLYLAHDVQHDEVMARGFTQREKIKSSAGFSLRVRGEPVGAMFINYRRPHRFTEGEKNIFTLFAQSAAIAIQNAQLYQKVSERLETASAMAWAGTAASLWAHEVQQNTFTICTDVATLRSRIPDSGIQEILDRIETTASALAEVVPSLPSRDVEEAVTLARVLKDVRKKRDKELQERNVRLQSNLETLPRVWANRQWLVEAFDGLTKNALRAMPGGGDLSFTGKVVGNKVLIDVIDSGKGFPEQLRNQLYKGRVVGPGRGGMGIGLLLVKTILNRYGGDIGLPYSDERGNVFPVQLPLVR